MKKKLVLGLFGCILNIAFVKADTVKVGAILPFSGGLEIFGTQAKAGIDLAVDEINQSGGVNGASLEIIYEDNKTDPKTSVEKANKLIRKDRVISLIGPITSSARDAMIPTLNRFKTPLLYATNYEGGLCEPHIFSFNTVPNQELEKLIPAMAIRKGKSFYLFGADYIWPQKMFERAEKEIKKIDGQIVGKSFTPWGVKDFTPMIRNIMKENPDVLVFALPGADGTTFLKQAITLGLTQKTTIAFLGFSETYLNAFDANNADIWVAVPFISTMPESRDFVKKAIAKNPKISGVSHYAKTHYNAIKQLANALKNSTNPSNKTALSGLKAIANNNEKLSQNQHAKLDMFIGKVDNNQLQMVVPLGYQSPEVSCR